MNRTQALWNDLREGMLDLLAMDSETCHHVVSMLAFHWFTRDCLIGPGLEWCIADAFMRTYRGNDPYTRMYCNG